MNANASSDMGDQLRDTHSEQDKVTGWLVKLPDHDQRDSRAVVEALASVARPRLNGQRSASCPPKLERNPLVDEMADAVDDMALKVQFDPVVAGPLKRRTSIVPIAKPGGAVALMYMSNHGNHNVVTVENAQTLLEPEACLFIANLPIQWSDAEIQLILTQAMSGGRKVYVKVNRGADGIPYAHVQYHDVEWALKMADGMQHQLIWNRQLRIEPATATRHLFLGFIDKTMLVPTEADVRKLLQAFMIDTVRQPSAEELSENPVDDCIVVQFAKWGECGEAAKALKDHEVFSVKAPKKSQVGQYKKFRSRQPKKHLTVRVPRYQQQIAPPQQGPSQQLAPPQQAASSEQFAHAQQFASSEQFAHAQQFISEEAFVASENFAQGQHFAHGQQVAHGQQLAPPYQLAPGQQMFQPVMSPYFSSYTPPFSPFSSPYTPLYSPMGFGNMAAPPYPMLAPTGYSPAGYGNMSAPPTLYMATPEWSPLGFGNMSAPQASNTAAEDYYPAGFNSMVTYPPSAGEPQQHSSVGFGNMMPPAPWMAPPHSVPGPSGPMMEAYVEPQSSPVGAATSPPPEMSHNWQPASTTFQPTPEPADTQPGPSDVQPGSSEVQPGPAGVQPAPEPATVEPTQDPVAGPAERPPKRRRQNNRRLVALPDISTPPF